MQQPSIVEFVAPQAREQGIQQGARDNYSQVHPYDTCFSIRTRGGANL